MSTRGFCVSRIEGGAAYSPRFRPAEEMILPSTAIAAATAARREVPPASPLAAAAWRRLRASSASFQRPLRCQPSSAVPSRPQPGSRYGGKAAVRMDVRGVPSMWAEEKPPRPAGCTRICRASPAAYRSGVGALTSPIKAKSGKSTDSHESCPSSIVHWMEASSRWGGEGEERGEGGDDSCDVFPILLTTGWELDRGDLEGSSSLSGPCVD